MHDVRTERERRVSVVCASGELDAYAAPDLDAAFAGLSGARLVLADLGSVSFMDSTALGVLVRSVRGFRQTNADVRVVLPRGPARRIFEITALDGELPVAADRSAAVAELEAG